MNAEIKKAVASTTATENNQQKISYLNAVLLSRVGQLLLWLNSKDTSTGWQHFEATLRKFYEVQV